MQAAKLPASAGWQWIRDGLALFRRQPLPIFTWAMSVSLTLMLASLLPPIGPLIFVLLVPAIGFLTLSICRHIDAGRAVAPSMWLQPLQRKGLFRRLLGMGGLYAALGIATGLLIFRPYLVSLSDDVIQAALAGGDLRPLMAAMRTPLILFTIANLITSAVFWYAPAMAGFFGTRIVQSLFFSAVACWRNKTAFVVYGLAWCAVFLSIDFAIDLIASLLLAMGLPPSFIMLIQIPVNVGAAAVLYCSVFPSYVSVFGHDAVNPPSVRKIDP